VREKRGNDHAKTKAKMNEIAKMVGVNLVFAGQKS
jgi:hypothetical protein